MKTREFADELNDAMGCGTVGSTDCIERMLLAFLSGISEGYSPAEPDRQQARLAAAQGGFFWLPCHICGRWFGGHEIGGRIRLNGRESVCTCNASTCIEESKRINQTFPDGIEFAEDE